MDDMNKLILLILLSGCTCTKQATVLADRTAWIDSMDNIRMEQAWLILNEKDIEWDLLWEAVAIEESRQTPNAKNPYSSATGYYQLLRGYVIEANRILGREDYIFDDRFSPIKSREMIEIVQGKYNPQRNLRKVIRLHRVGWNTGMEIELAKYKKRVLYNLDSLKNGNKSMYR